MAAGNFNGDANPDLVVSTSLNVVSVLLGNGDGAFQPALSFDVGNGPVSVAVGNLNSDSFLDVVTANDGGNNVSVLLGNGNGTLRAAPLLATVPNDSAVGVADVNKDGLADIVVSALTVSQSCSGSATARSNQP